MRETERHKAGDSLAVRHKAGDSLAVQEQKLTILANKNSTKIIRVMLLQDWLHWFC